jgi:hypothetical protein
MACFLLITSDLLSNPHAGPGPGAREAANLGSGGRASVNEVVPRRIDLVKAR